MKNNNLKFWSVAYLLFFVLFTGTLFAQSTMNLTGTFEGLRSQFDKSHKSFSSEFQYKYELTQKGNIVEGISTIISAEGNYAEVGIRGVVIINKFYFEEYSMKDQITSENMVWCYKSGVLNITQKDGKLTLSGETPSYMVNYGYACTGGFTKLSAFVETNEEVPFKNGIGSVGFEFNLFPNPTTDIINFSFNSSGNQKVTIEIFDLAGRSLIGNTTRSITKGNFSETINIEKLGFTAGLYIFKMTLGKQVYTKEFVVATK